MATLSVCMITYQNESTLEKSLASIKDLANEIIIVDTGSSDKTKEIANNFHGKVFDFKWKNDFSAARNFALQKATKDWILILDSDEYLEKSTAELIKNWINETHYKACSVWIQNVLPNIPVSKIHPSIRLFINDPCIHYKHKLHEQMYWSFLENYPMDKIYASNFIFHHIGYSSPIIVEEKMVRNKKILDSYKENEKDAYFYYLLGNQTFYEKDFPTALLHYDQAVQNKKMVWGQLQDIFIKRCHCLYELGHYQTAFNAIQLALEKMKLPELIHLKNLILEKL